jgi:hypothetical protein
VNNSAFRNHSLSAIHETTDMINRTRLKASHHDDARKSRGATAHAAEPTKPTAIPATMTLEGFGARRRPGASGTRRPGAVLIAGLLLPAFPAAGALATGLLITGLFATGLFAAGLSAAVLSTGGLPPVGLGGGLLLMESRRGFNQWRCPFIGPAVVATVKRVLDRVARPSRQGGRVVQRHHEIAADSCSCLTNPTHRGNVCGTLSGFARDC